MSSQGELYQEYPFKPGREEGVYYGIAPTGMDSISLPAQRIPAPSKPDLPAQAHTESELGEGLFNQGRFDEAIARFANAIQLQPRNPKYHYQCACAAWKKGESQKVSKHLFECIELDPGYVRAHQILSLWYLQQDRHDMAIKHASTAFLLEPNSEETCISMAEVLIATGRYDEAHAKLKPFIDRGACGVYVARAIGKLARQAGRETEAIDVIQKTLRAGNVTPSDRAQLHSALFPLLEKMKRYDEAFAHARLAKEAVRPPHDPRLATNTISNWIRYFSREHLQVLPRASHGSRRPVFIVGMPRSGTSLVEQILASHPAVYGAGELKRLSEILQPDMIARWSQVKQYPQCIDDLSIRRTNHLANEYLKTIHAINSSATYVTDKMPENHLHLGVIQILFPQSRVIHCIRDPRDTCLSCFMTMFLQGQNFSHDLGHLAQWYRDYQRLMAHWKSALDLPILDVRYEELVADQEGESRKMLDFLGLAWDPRCLNFHQTGRSVPTASHEQVRKPIYTSSLGRWKNYEKHIPELMALVEG